MSHYIAMDEGYIDNNNKNSIQQLRINSMVECWAFNSTATGSNPVYDKNAIRTALIA